MRYLLLFLLVSGISMSCTASKMPVKAAIYPTVYEVSMPEPASHYFEVKVTINDPEVLNKAFVDFRMATWTPGSYLIREYSKNIESLNATSTGGALEVQKTAKNRWKISGNHGKPITVSYRLYAFELTVRTNFLDASHGYFNGAATFLYVPELMDKKALVKINPHQSFGKVSVALPEVSKNQFEAENYDLLVDSPFEIGNQEILEFEALGVNHRIANYSIEPLAYNKEQLIEDYKKVVIGSHSVFGGEHPCKEYLFIIHHLPRIGGGLEHLNSTTCQTSPKAYTDGRAYIGFMGLLAHEYFHLWNVKRLRPVALEPFDYENENYTHMLWVARGFTNYYEDDILRRAGLIDENQMLLTLANGIGSIENQPGNKVQPVTEASWDAWIKYYRPNENSYNSTVSYYSKGGVLANIINMIIIGNSNGEKSLDNVMQNLYNNLYLKKNVGFTDEEFLAECSKVAGEDLSGFFNKHVSGTESVDYAKYFAMVDVDAKMGLANPDTPYFGARIRNGSVVSVEAQTGAYVNGINVNDQILAVDGDRNADVDQVVKNKKVGDVIKVTVKRSGVVYDYNVTLNQDPRIRIILTPQNSTDAISKKKYSKWMHVE